MLQMAELAVTGRLANPPEQKTGRKGEPVAILHLLVEGLGKEGGEIKPAWCRTTLFGELAQTALATFKKGDQVFARGSPTLDKWKGKNGEAAAGLSMIASEAIVLGIVLRPPEEAPYVPPSARLPRDTPDTKKATKVETPAKSPRPKPELVGGLPPGPRSYTALRIKQEIPPHWQRPLDWADAGGDRLDDVFSK